MQRSSHYHYRATQNQTEEQGSTSLSDWKVQVFFNSDKVWSQVNFVVPLATPHSDVMVTHPRVHFYISAATQEFKPLRSTKISRFSGVTLYTVKPLLPRFNDDNSKKNIQESTLQEVTEWSCFHKKKNNNHELWQHWWQPCLVFG